MLNYLTISIADYIPVGHVQLRGGGQRRGGSSRGGRWGGLSSWQRGGGSARGGRGGGAGGVGLLLGARDHQKGFIVIVLEGFLLECAGHFLS